MNRDDQKMSRCFIAVNLPEAAKAFLTETQTALKSWPAKVKWVEPGNFHLTLKFLGDISETRIAELGRSLGEAAARISVFAFNIKGFGCFPNLRQPRVIWAGLNDNEGSLKALWSEVEKACGKLGLPPEARSFAPHLTIGRVKEDSPPPGLGDFLAKLPRADIAVSVPAFYLMESRLSRQGPTYTCLHEFFLQKSNS